MIYYKHYFVKATGESDLNPCELEYLEELLLSQPFDYYVEVGIGYLGTVCRMAQRIAKDNLTCKCIGIDAFGKLPPDADGNNSHQGDVITIESARQLLVDRKLEHIVTLHKGDSAKLLEQVLEPLKKKTKLVFIDANHTYNGCLEDYKAAAPLLEEGDVLVFHDTLKEQHPDYGRGPRGVVEDYLLDNPRYSCRWMPDHQLKLSIEVNTIAAFDVLGPEQK